MWKKDKRYSDEKGDETVKAMYTCHVRERKGGRKEGKEREEVRERGKERRKEKKDFIKGCRSGSRHRREYVLTPTQVMALTCREKREASL